MSGWFRAICCWMWLWGAAWTAGCVPTAQPPAPPSTQIPLSAFGNVAGNWAGIMTMTPRSGNDDWITVTINEDGTYRFESVRQRRRALCRRPGSGEMNDGTKSFYSFRA